MSRPRDLLSWIAGALAFATGYWYVVVYLLDDFDRGYGSANWFQLSLYLSLIFSGAGVVGYAVVSVLWKQSRTFVASLLAGVAFALGEILFTFALKSAYPDHDMVVASLVAAPAIGALSALVPRPRP